MNPWVPLLALSGVAGVLAAILFKGGKAILIGSAIPWFGLLAWLLYNEYFVPFQGGGASMWPVAQLFGGSIAAAVGAGAALLTRRARQKG